MAAFARRLSTRRPAQVAAMYGDVFTISLVKPGSMGFLWLLSLAGYAPVNRLRSWKIGGLGVLPFRLELRGRGQRHLLLPSTRSVTLGGRIGKRRNSHVTWCLLSHGLGISSFQRPGTLRPVRVALTALFKPVSNGFSMAEGRFAWPGLCQLHLPGFQWPL